MADQSTMPWYSTTALATLSALVAWEAPHGRSREPAVIANAVAAEVTRLFGTVLGRRLIGAPAIAAVAGNTGNGTLGTLNLAVDVKVGVYTAICIAAAANGGTFAVYDPDGYRLRDASVGVAYDGGPLAFTIADGATDFAAGDVFTVTVAAGDDAYVSLDPDAEDGSQVAAAVLIARTVIAASSTANAQIIAREADLVDAGMVWPDGITDGEKAAAIGQLKAAGIRVLQAA